jgi:hypothetical protein
MHANTVMCGLLILFFSWMLAHHAFVPHSKSKSNSDTWVEGFVPKQAEAAAAESELKKQLETLAQTAQQLRTQMISNEAGIQKNTANLQEIIKSQNETNAKMAEMKNNAK